MRISLTFAAGLLLVAVPAMAATRDDRPDRDTGSTPPQSLPAPAPTPAPQIPNTSSHNSGSITSHTSVSTNSGNNQGGSVVTGDQTSTITVVNVGPTGGSTQVINPAPQQGQPTQCSGRDCPRMR
jgi:hypothetical protein